jgi:hypothetical protein
MELREALLDGIAQGLRAGLWASAVVALAIAFPWVVVGLSRPL